MILATGNPSVIWLVAALLFGVLPTLISLLGGWYALAARYRRAGPLPDGEHFTFVSMSLRRAAYPIPAGYRASVSVRLTAGGLALSVQPFLRLLHPPLLIPWAAIAECHRKQRWWGQVVVVDLAQPAVRLSLDGTVGERLLRACAELCLLRETSAVAGQTPALVPAWLRRRFSDLSGQ